MPQLEQVFGDLEHSLSFYCTVHDLAQLASVDCSEGIVQQAFICQCETCLFS